MLALIEYLLIFVDTYLSWAVRTSTIGVVFSLAYETKTPLFSLDRSKGYQEKKERDLWGFLAHVRV